MDSIKARSFVSTRIHLLAPEELRFTKEIHIEQRRDRNGIVPDGIIIARLEPNNRQSLRGLYDKLVGDKVRPKQKITAGWASPSEGAPDLMNCSGCG